jgi:hypothetical protein
MATLHILAGRAPPALHKIEVPLDRGEQPERLIYGFPEFTRWITEDLPSLETGRLKAADKPREQLDNVLYRWIAGKDVAYGKMFKDLMPGREEVWEMKTADLRVFGWMYRPRIFIAVFGDYADSYKGRNPSANYTTARNWVKTARDSLDIDRPKFATGSFDDLVCV